MDSGAFSDSPEKRLSPEAAIERQFGWERKAERFWKYLWRAEYFASYDLLIDEKWSQGKRTKERWSVAEADRAVRVTVDAAAYLASQRGAICPRKCLLGCQGVDPIQYLECLQGVLAYATMADVIGLGGWCIIGRQKNRWLPTFWASMQRVIPLVKEKGISHVHIFGVMWRRALGPLLWLCDQNNILLSTDSSGPSLSVLWKDQKRAGWLKPDWEDNVIAWRDRLANLRSSEYYHEPPSPHSRRQLTLF